MTDPVSIEEHIGLMSFLLHGCVWTHWIHQANKMSLVCIKHMWKVKPKVIHSWNAFIVPSRFS